MRYLIVLILSTLIPASSFASFKGGNELHAACSTEGKESVDYAATSLCLGYVQGIVDAHVSYVEWGVMPPNFCIQRGVTVGQLVKVALKHMNEHPEKLHLTAASLVTNAFAFAFPASVKDDGTRYCPAEGATE